MDESAAKWKRVRQANKVIAILANHGARFFYSKAYDRTARFGLDRHDQTWLIDCATGLRVYPFGTGSWPGFTLDGFLKSFAARLAQYIEKGDKITIAWFELDQFKAAYDQEAADEVRRLVLETDAVTKDK